MPHAEESAVAFHSSSVPAPNSVHVSWDRVICNLLAGAGAGAITKTSVAPLDRVKILLQVQGMMKEKRYSGGILGTLMAIVRDEGALALYKGNWANVVRVVPVYALKFSFNDTFVEWTKLPGQTKRDLSWTQLMLAGTLAGLFQQTITYPLDVVRTRMTLPTKAGGNYTSITNCLRRMVAEEGGLSLYKGYTATLMSGGPYVGLQMSFYELFKRIYPKGEDGKPTLFWKLAGGASAGMAAQSITYPLDTIRRRMQADGIAGAAKKYNSNFHCLQTILKQEGLLAFYRGLSATIVRCIPGAAIQFASYDTLKHLLGSDPE